MRDLPICKFYIQPTTTVTSAKGWHKKPSGNDPDIEKFEADPVSWDLNLTLWASGFIERLKFAFCVLTNPGFQVRVSVTSKSEVTYKWEK